jgi:hypothetical protein
LEGEVSTIRREATVQATGDRIWEQLIADPNGWSRWLTPVRGVEEHVSGPTHEGTEFSVRLGKIGGKVKVTEAVPGQRLRWKAGPAMMLAMGMGMRGTLELRRGGNGATRVLLEMRTPAMMTPMMKMMSGLDPEREMTQTISRIRELSA